MTEPSAKADTAMSDAEPNAHHNASTCLKPEKHELISASLDRQVKSFGFNDAESLYRDFIRTDVFMKPWLVYRDKFLLHPTFGQQALYKNGGEKLSVFFRHLFLQINGRAVRTRRVNQHGGAWTHTLRLYSAFALGMMKRGGIYEGVNKKYPLEALEMCKQLYALVKHLRVEYGHGHGVLMEAIEKDHPSQWLDSSRSSDAEEDDASLDEAVDDAESELSDYDEDLDEEMDDIDNADDEDEDEGDDDQDVQSIRSPSTDRVSDLSQLEVIYEGSPRQRRPLKQPDYKIPSTSPTTDDSASPSDESEEPNRTAPQSLKSEHALDHSPTPAHNSHSSIEGGNDLRSPGEHQRASRANGLWSQMRDISEADNNDVPRSEGKPEEDQGTASRRSIEPRITALRPRFKKPIIKKQAEKTREPDREDQDLLMASDQRDQELLTKSTQKNQQSSMRSVPKDQKLLVKPSPKDQELLKKMFGGERRWGVQSSKKDTPTKSSVNQAAHSESATGGETGATEPIKNSSQNEQDQIPNVTDPASSVAAPEPMDMDEASDNAELENTVINGIVETPFVENVGKTSQNEVSDTDKPSSSPFSLSPSSPRMFRGPGPIETSDNHTENADKHGVASGDQSTPDQTEHEMDLDAAVGLSPSVAEPYSSGYASHLADTQGVPDNTSEADLGMLHVQEDHEEDMAWDGEIVGLHTQGPRSSESPLFEPESPPSAGVSDLDLNEDVGEMLHGDMESESLLTPEEATFESHVPQMTHDQSSTDHARRVRPSLHLADLLSSIPPRGEATSPRPATMALNLHSPHSHSGNNPNGVLPEEDPFLSSGFSWGTHPTGGNAYSEASARAAAQHARWTRLNEEEEERRLRDAYERSRSRR